MEPENIMFVLNFYVFRAQKFIFNFFNYTFFRDCHKILYILGKFHSKSMKTIHELSKK